MRLTLRAIACICLALGLSWTARWAASASPAQEMFPDESAAKAKRVLQQVIAALGGQAYLNVSDSECVGRFWEPVPVGVISESTEFRDLWLLPDKKRTEYSIKHDQNILPFLLGTEGGLTVLPGSATIVVFAGSTGWFLNSQKHVEDQPDDVMKDFHEDLKTNLNNMLRVRLKEPGVEARYAGPDIIDLKEAEWIEFTDRDHRDLRLAIDKQTHLPMRWVIATRDPETGERTEATTSYAQYLTQGGVKTPLSILQQRSDHKISQTFLTECKFNSGLDPQLFTRAALEQRAAEVSKKGYKDSKTKK